MSRHTDESDGSNLDRDVKIFLGIRPYNTSSNICLGDGYFYADRERHYGKEKWENAVKKRSRP